MVLAPDDVADLHRGVIDNDREVIQRRAVGTDDHEVSAEVRDVDLHASAHDVVEGDHTLAHPEPERSAFALGFALGSLVEGQVRASSDIPRRLLRRLLGLAIGIEPLGAAITGIRLFGREQAFGGGSVVGQSLSLPIWSVRTASRLAGDLGALVPAETQPVEAIEDVLLVRQRAARLVGVL
jgi:hypothetical protein